MKNLSRHEVYGVLRRAMKTLLISAGAFALAACLPVGKLLTGLFIIAAVLAAAAAMLVAG